LTPLAPSKPGKTVFLLGGLFLAAHLGLALSAGLSVDEAHYALYALRLDWSYFDHPPLAGWLQVPALALGGSDFAVRCAPLVCWLATIFLIRRLIAALFPGPDSAWTADAGALILLAGPLFQVLGVALLPASLLLPIACGVMGLTWRLRDPARAGQLGPWLGLGLVLGLAGLSEYTGIFLALSSAGFLLWEFGPRLLAARGPWVAVAVAAALISPVLVWNARHGWISLAFQARHAVGAEWRDLGGVEQFLGRHGPDFKDGPRRSWDWREMVRAELVQMAAYGPLLVLGLFFGCRTWRRQPAARLCLAFALPPMVVIAAFAGLGGSLPHWAGFAWIAAVPLAAAGLRDGWQSARGRRWISGIGAVQLALCGLGFALAWRGGPAEDSALKLNPFADLYGWDRAADRAKALAAAYHVDSLAVSNWTLASRLGWYARPLPVHVLDKRSDQFSLWYGKLPPGQSTLLVDWSRMSYALPVSSDPAQGFAECRPAGELPVDRLGRVLSHFDFYRCGDWRAEIEPQRR
jgi:4-amino-4-deoxy-L-arabinose transferase-like glycosyltransferase